MIHERTMILLFAGIMTSVSWGQLPLEKKPDMSTEATKVETPQEAANSGATQPAPEIPAEILTIGAVGAKFDKLDGICSTWNIGCPTAGDTITRDEGGVRSWFAHYNIGFIGIGTANFGYNFLQAPQNPQVYNDEKPNWSEGTHLWMTYNIPSKKMQFVVGGSWLASNYTGIGGPNALRPNSAYLYQSLLDGKLSYTIGYESNDATVYGGYIAGDIATGTMGVNAVIPYELGMGFTPFLAPTFTVKYSLKSGPYAIAAVQRSIDPRGSQVNISRDPWGFRLFPHGEGALYMPEIGYKKSATPGGKETWLRITGFYNSSHYQDYSSPQNVLTGVKGHNGAASVVFERQITQSDKYLPYRGIYWTATGQWAAPDFNVYHQYYQFALYEIGLLRKRPLDVAILNVNRTQFSRTALNTFEQLPHSLGSQMGVPVYDDSTAASLTYGYHVRSGTILSGELSYTKHPTSSPRLDNPLIGVVQLMFYF